MVRDCRGGRGIREPSRLARVRGPVCAADLWFRHRPLHIGVRGFVQSLFGRAHLANCASGLSFAGGYRLVAAYGFSYTQGVFQRMCRSDRNRGNCERHTSVQAARVKKRRRDNDHDGDDPRVSGVGHYLSGACLSSSAGDVHTATPSYGSAGL